MKILKIGQEIEESKIKKIPYTQNIGEIRKQFVDRYNSTPEDQRVAIKEQLQKEYEAAIAEHEADIAKQKKESYEHNLNAFLNDPKGVIEELNQLRGRAFDMGELLIHYGIATATIKRQKGKGTLIGKGTLGEHTISNFLVTVKIGEETFSTEVGSANDKRDKERTMASVAAQFALEIARRK
jgi:hypothetical protein